MRLPGILMRPLGTDITRRQRHAAKLLLIGLLASMPAAGNEARTVLHIYKYSNSDTALPAQRFNEFKQILQDKIVLLAEELKQQGPAFDYIGQLQPHYVINQATGEHVPLLETNLDALRDRWRQTGALEILYGRLFEHDGSYEARSRIYLGGLAGDLDKDSIRVDLPITDSQYDTTRDSHSVAILYGLAMDARQRCRPASEVSALLSTAREAAMDLPTSLPGISDLKAAIERGLQQPQSCTVAQP